MAKRLTDREIAEIRRAGGEAPQRELAAEFGVSQATISRLLRDEPDGAEDEDCDDPQIGPPGGWSPRVRRDGYDDDEEPVDAEAELGLTPVKDLERRILDLARTARRAEKRGQFGAAVTARKLSAKLRVDLERARDLERTNRPVTRLPEPDEALIAELVAVVDLVPEAAFEAFEDAVDRRRRRAAEAPRDGG